MKTVQAIATEHLNKIKTVELAPQAEIIRYSQEIMARVHDRMQNDPAIIEIAEYFSRQMMLAAQLPMPEAAKQTAVRGAVINCIIEWEQIHAEFNDQLKPSP
jgi:hypothetical protein